MCVGGFWFGVMNRAWVELCIGHGWGVWIMGRGWGVCCLGCGRGVCCMGRGWGVCCMGRGWGRGIHVECLWWGGYFHVLPLLSRVAGGLGSVATPCAASNMECVGRGQMLLAL